MTRFITLGRDEYDSHLKATAHSRREFLTQLIKQAFEGSELFTPEHFWQFMYCFENGRSECGKQLGIESSNANDCLIITKGTCNVYKRKNIIAPFKTWMESIHATVRDKFSSTLSLFDKCIKDMTEAKIKVATLGPGEFICPETLIAASQPQALVTKKKHAHKSRDAKEDIDQSKERIKPDQVSLFTIEVSSETVEYLRVSRYLTRLFMKGQLKENFIERFFNNLKFRSELMMTKISLNPNSRPFDYRDRNDQDLTKIDEVRVLLYRYNNLRIDSITDNVLAVSPNKRDRWLDVEKRRFTKVNLDMVEAAKYNEKVYRHLNDQRKTKHYVYHPPPGIRPKLKSHLNDGFRECFVSRQGSVKSRRDQKRSADEDSSCQAKSLVIRPLSVMPLSSKRATIANSQRDTPTCQDLGGVTGSSLFKTLRSQSAGQPSPSAYVNLRLERPFLIGHLMTRAPSSKPSTKKNMAIFNSHSVDPNSLGDMNSTTQSGFFTNTCRRKKSETEPKVTARERRPSSHYCERERRKLKTSKSIRAEQIMHFTEQSVFNPRNSQATTRKAVELLRTLKAAGGDCLEVSRKPTIHLSATIN